MVDVDPERRPCVIQARNDTFVLKKAARNVELRFVIAALHTQRVVLLEALLQHQALVVGVAVSGNAL